MTLLPLHGVRVLDLTRVLAGPYATMMLADLGADVVKIERPDGGDDARQFGPFLASGESAYFASINRGKRSITLNLKDPKDRNTFLQLIDCSDVVVENYRPGTMEHLGIEAAFLRERNPRLIYASATGFGRTGRDAERAAYDVIVQARSGLMSLTGHDPASPARVGSSISDILTGMYTAFGIAAALRQREQTGRGCDLDLSMLECTVSTLENAVVLICVTGDIPGPLGTSQHRIHRTVSKGVSRRGWIVRDRRRQRHPVAYGLCRSDRGYLELIADPLLATNRDRASNLAHLEKQIEARLFTKTISEWLTVLDAAGVPAAPICNLAQVVTDSQLHDRGMWHTLTDTDGKTLLTAGSPVTIDDDETAMLSGATLAPIRGTQRCRPTRLAEEESP